MAHVSTLVGMLAYVTIAEQYKKLSQCGQISR